LSNTGNVGTPIVAFSDKKPARLLADFLTSSNVEVRIIKGKPHLSDDGANAPSEDKIEDLHFQVVVIDPNDVAKALVIAEDFVANPNQAKYQQAAWEVGSTFDDAKGKNHGKKSSRSAAPNWLQDFKSTPFMTLVMLICVAVFALSYLGAFNAIYQVFTIRSFAELSQSHEWWRLFTPAFIHFSVIHIMFNLIWWWVLGSQLERIFGTWLLVIIFTIAAISSNVAQLLVTGPDFGGLSGVVYALFGFVWWIGLLRPQWGIGLPTNLVIFLLGWLALGYFDVLWVNMANEAHLFGLISGCAMALITHQLAGLLKPKR